MWTLPCSSSRFFISSGGAILGGHVSLQDWLLWNQVVV
ncbi:unnamed protein product, partial [Vitis vinifera]|uniref:Uncharacterized protein n=1 Tax=Vitis vinifera TaxID=29760 RepID=D7T2U4_VITVI